MVRNIHYCLTNVFTANNNVYIALTLCHRDGETFIRPISVRYMHNKEVEHYEKTIAHPNY